MSGLDERPKPLPNPILLYDHEGKYPYSMRVSFDDGTTAIYDLRIEQPHPIIERNCEIIRKWKQGYNNQPSRRRRRNG